MLVKTGVGGTSKQDGDIIVANAITVPEITTNNLTLQAHRNIEINAAIDFSKSTGHLVLWADGVASDGSGAIVNGAGGNITMGASGALQLIAGSGIGTAVSGIQTNGTVNVAAKTTTGGVFIDHTGVVGGLTVTEVSTLTGTGITTKTTGVTATGDVTLTTASGVLALANDITTTTGDITFTNALTLKGDVVLKSGTGAITLAKVDAATAGGQGFTLTGSDVTTLGDIVGGTTALKFLTVDGGGTATLTGNVTTKGGAITFNDALSLTGNVTLDTTANAATAGAAITLAGVSGSTTARDLTLNAGTAGFVTASGDIGTNIGTLTLTNSGGASFKGITAGTLVLTDTTDATTITVNGALKLGTLTTTTAGYNLALLGGGTVDSATDTVTTIENGGTLTLGDASTDNLTFTDGLTANPTGALTLAGTIQTTDAAITFNKALTLAQDVVLNSGTGSIDLKGTVNATTAGAQGLTLMDGDTILGAALGGTTALKSLTVDGGGTATLAGNVTTSGGGEIKFVDALSLTVDAVLTSSGGAITLAAVNAVAAGGQGLTLNSGAGVTTLGGVVGTTALKHLTTDAGAGATELGFNVSTTGAITFGDNLKLLGNVLLDTTKGAATGAAINLASVSADAVANNRTLTLNAGTAGAVKATGGIGTQAGGALAELKLTNSNGATFQGITAETLVLTDTTDNETIATNGALTLGTLTTTTAGYNLALLGGGTVDSATDTVTTIANGGTLALGDASTDVLIFTDGLTANPTGALTLAGTIQTTNKAITFNQAVTLAQDVVLASGGGAITLAAVNAKDAGKQGLTLNSGAGVTTLGGVVGATALKHLITDAGAGATELKSNVSTTGAITFADTLTLAQDVVLASGGGAITLAAVNATDAGKQGLTLNSGTGVTTLDGVVGAIALEYLTTDAGAGATELGFNVSTTGAITFGDNLKLLGNVTLDTTKGAAADGAITLAGVSGSTTVYDLTLNAGTAGFVTASGDIGSNIGTLTLTNSGGASFEGITAGTLDLQDTTDATTITVNGALKLGTLTTTSEAYNLALLGGGTVDTATTIENGGTLALGDESKDFLIFTVGLTASPTGKLTLAGTIQTNDAAITFNQALTLTQDVVLDSGTGNIELKGTVNATDAGAQGLTLTHGGTTLDAALGGTKALKSLTVDGSATLAGNVTTQGGAITFNDALSLTGNVTLDTTTKDAPKGGAITLLAGVSGSAANSTLTLNAGTDGFITASGAIGSNIDTLTLTNSGGASFKGITATTLVLTDTTDGTTITVNGALNLGTLTTKSEAYNLALLGGGTVDSATNEVTTIANGGTLTLGAAGTTLTFTDGLTANPTGTLTLAGIIQTTNKAITFNQAVTLAQDVVLNSGTGSIELKGTVNATKAGAQGLTLTGSGLSTLGDIVGGTTALKSLTLDGDGTATLAGNVTTKDGLIAIGDTLTLTGDAVLSSGSGAITLAQVDATTAGAQGLTLTGSGPTTLGAALGGGTALKSLTVDGGGTATLAGNVTTKDGLITIGDTLTLTVDAVLKSGSGAITLAQVDATTAGDQGLTLTGSGLTTLGAALGGGTALKSLIVDGGGDTHLAANVATKGGVITFADTLSLTGDVILATTTNAAAGADIMLEGVSGSAANSTLTLDAGTDGRVTASQTIETNIGMLTLINSGSATFAGITADTLDLRDTAGTITIDGAVDLTTLSTAAQGYHLALLGGGSVDTATTLRNTGTLTLGDGGDRFTFSGGVTATAPTEIRLAGTLKTSGQVIELGDANSPIVLMDHSRLDTTAGAGNGRIILGGAVNEAVENTSLSLAAGTADIVFKADIGATNPIGLVTIESADQVTFANITADELNIGELAPNVGTLTIAGNLKVSTLTTSERPYNLALLGSANEVTNQVTFKNAGTLTLGDQVSDTSTFHGGLTATSQSTIRLAGNILTSKHAIGLGGVRTRVIFTENTLLGSAGGTITLGGTLAAEGPATAENLTLRAGAGMVNFGANVDSTHPLGLVQIETTGPLTAGGSISARELRIIGAASVGAAGQRLVTRVGNLALTNVGSAFLENSGNLSFLSSVLAGDLNLINFGTVALHQVQTPRQVTLTATGGLTDANGGAANLVADRLVIKGGAAVASSQDALETQVRQLQLTTGAAAITKSFVGGAITMAPDTSTRNVGGSIEYAAANTVTLGILEGKTVTVTAVNGDVIGADRTSAIYADVATIQALGGDIGAGPTDPLLFSGNASEINLAFDGQAYVDSIDGRPLDAAVKRADYALYSLTPGGEPGEGQLRVRMSGGNLVVLSSAARDASGQSQRTGEKAPEDVNESLLRGEQEINTVEGVGVQLPADQLEEAEGETAVVMPSPAGGDESSPPDAVQPADALGQAAPAALEEPRLPTRGIEVSWRGPLVPATRGSYVLSSAMAR
ncbi:hypothetical protein [uncultured Lamprocystis sp.]|uniref:hypothetical protein n=1 Tax=uncultured Lamprocystis sp. TaxID=543132 RepID=UPI0025FB5257|nr:hypothetical protein [uncultured Lamprocystis sp.]